MIGAILALLAGVLLGALIAYGLGHDRGYRKGVADATRRLEGVRPRSHR